MTATAGRENRFQPSGGGVGRQGGAAPVAADAPSAAPAKKRFGKKKLIIMAVVGLVVVGAAYKFFLAPKPPYKPSGGDTVALDVQTLNLAGGHYLKAGISVQLLKGKASAAKFDSSQADELVIEEFSNKTVESLATNDARSALMKDLLANMKKAYPDEIWQVYVTQFVTQ